MGLFRLLLAALVVVQHIAGLKYIGASAVFSFFVLSGYLMTHVMHKSYGYDRQGVAAFWLNRILRLYPAYWIVLLISVLVIEAVGTSAAQSFNPVMRLPETFGEGWQTLSMWYLSPTPISAAPRLSPPTWALTIELFNYLLISLGVSRSLKSSVIWMLGGLLFVGAVTVFANGSQTWGYGSIPAAFFPFGLGAMLFHLRQQGRVRVSQRTARGLIVLGAIGLLDIAGLRYLLYQHAPDSRYLLVLHQLNFVPALIAVIGCLDWKPRGAQLRRLNALAGNLSYPLYLNHWIVALAVSSAVQAAGHTLTPLALLAVTLPVALGLSWGLATYVDRPIENLRTRIRSKSPFNTA